VGYRRAVAWSGRQPKGDVTSVTHGKTANWFTAWPDTFASDTRPIRCRASAVSGHLPKAVAGSGSRRLRSRGMPPHTVRSQGSAAALRGTSPRSTQPKLRGRNAKVTQKSARQMPSHNDYPSKTPLFPICFSGRESGGMADALDLGSSAARRAGSSPASRNPIKQKSF
jgi:hypothetical protein